MSEENLENIDISGMSIITIISEDVNIVGGLYEIIFGNEGTVFTLKDCYNIAVGNGDRRGCITVLVEYPLRGKVYRYGNHGEYWEEVGTLKDYA